MRKQRQIKQTKDNSARIKSERDAMYKMYDKCLIILQRKNGQTAEQIIKKNQDELRQRKKYIDEMTSMYARMFDEIAKKNLKIGLLNTVEYNPQETLQVKHLLLTTDYIPTKV